MSHRKPPRSSGKCEYVSQAYAANKGLAPSTRQQGKEQTKTRLVSDYTDKHQNFTSNERPQRKNDDSLNPQNHQRRLPNIHEENGKFSNNRSTPADAIKKQQIKKRFMEIKKQNLPFEYRNEKYRQSISDTDSEIDSLYDDEFDEVATDGSESMAESDCSPRGEIKESIQSLERGLNRATKNYVRKVKSRVGEAMSKMKIQEKHKEPVVKRLDVQGAGDKAPLTEEVHKKMNMMKQECYKKIEANLKMLKNIDSVTDEIFFKHSNARAEK